MKNSMNTEELFKKYPYAFAHNSWTGELCLDDNNMPFAEDESLPIGWHKLFWQCMEDLRKPLEDAGLLEKFYFVQVKEKYATMRLYHSGATEEIQRIIDDYEQASEFICEKCGKRATKQTRGWITSLCDDCANKDASNYIEVSQNTKYRVTQFTPDGDITIERDISSIINRLYEE